MPGTNDSNSLRKRPEAHAATEPGFLEAPPGASGEWRDWPASVVGGALKRIFDVCCVSVLIVLLAPLALIVALVVKLQDGGPVIYGHRRVGLGGRFFRCLKVRSMVPDADRVLADLLRDDPEAAREWATTHKLRNDPRVTPFGALLRKSSIDELPQLINVLRGDMSLVGPRPVVADELEHYGLARVHYLRARPGLTGLWQVSGRSNTSYRKRVELDKHYTLRWSLAGDFLILARTIPALAARSGAM